MSLHPEHDLLQAYLDAELPLEEAKRLEQRLGREPILADALIFLAREESICCEWASATAVVEVTVPDEELSVVGLGGPIGRPTTRARLYRRAIAVTAMAAAITLVAFLSAFWSLPSRPVKGLALGTLEEVHGDVQLVTLDGSIQDAEAGQSVYSGQEIRTGEDGSSTVLRVYESRLVLAPETRIRLGRETPISDASVNPFVFVSEGIVAAELVPHPSGRPMVISSALAEFMGSTGRFNFASLPDLTRVESDDGTAQVKRTSDGQVVEVSRGFFTVASRTNEPLKSRNLPGRSANAMRTLSETGPIVGLAFDPEGAFLTSCAGDTIKRWDLTGSRVSSTIRLAKKKPARGFAASSNGKLFALSGNDERPVKTYDAGTGLENGSYKGLKRPVALALAPDSRLLAVSWSAGKEGHEVRLYDTVLGVERVLHTGHLSAVQCLAFSPQGRYLATAGDRTVKIWDTGSLGLLRNIPKLTVETRTLAFSPDEHLLAVGDRKGGIRLLDTSSGVEKSQVVGHLRDVTTLAFSPDGLFLVSGGTDGVARLWIVETASELTSVRVNNHSVSAVAFSQDGRTLATGGTDRKILLWDVAQLIQP